MALESGARRFEPRLGFKTTLQGWLALSKMGATAV